MTRNIPLSMDSELLTEIHKLVKASKENRSAVMRRVMRAGLDAIDHQKPLKKRQGVALAFAVALVVSRDKEKKFDMRRNSNAAVMRDAYGFADAFLNHAP